MSTEQNISPARILQLRTRYGLSQDEFAERLGVSRNYVSMLERGAKEVSETSSIGILFGLLEQNSENPKNLGFSAVSTPHRDSSAAVREEPLHFGGMRRIPVIGWAHAGQAASYEELPESWQIRIPTDCRDPKAFAVTLEGDSMEPLCRDGDMLVLMPSERIHNGCLAVVRLASDGVLLRRLEVRGPRLRLVPLNSRYEAEEMDCEQISWAYPVWGCWRQIWK